MDEVQLRRPVFVTGEKKPFHVYTTGSGRVTAVALPAWSVPVTVNVCVADRRRVEVRAVRDRADARVDPGLACRCT